MKRDQARVNQGLKSGQLYRSHPTMAEANVVGQYLVDLQGLNLQFFNVKDFSLHKRVEVIRQQDKYCAQIGVVSNKVLVIFGVNRFMLFQISDMKLIDTVQINNYIQKLEVRNGYLAILTSDQDFQNKIVYCWKIDTQTGQVAQTYKPTKFTPVDYEECTEDNLQISLIVSIEGNPKVYVYWKDTTSMIQIDPVNQLKDNYKRHSPITLVYDLSSETYAEIVGNKIYVNDKKNGKRVAQLVSQGQKFTQLFSRNKSNEVFTISNFGFKQWKLQSNSTPVLYSYSDKQQINKVFFAEDQTVIGLNLSTNTVIVWKNAEEYEAHSFPHQVIRKMVKINDHLAFFLLQATANSEEQNEYHVSKYNKLEIFDFNLDREVAKKAMLKSQHSVDINSALVNDEHTIRFIVNEKAQQGGNEKKYILKWTPFEKDETGKDTKKKEIKGSHLLGEVRLYPFNRILGLTLGKKKDSSNYAVFSNKIEEKTQIVIYDYSVKKIGEYDLEGQISNVELSNKNIYTIGPKRVCIYSIASENKNRMEKVNQLDIAAISITPIREFLLIKKDTSYLLLDADFECIMREETEQEQQNFKVIPIDEDKFVLKTEQKVQIWDIAKESTDVLECPKCEPNVVEVMEGKLVVACNEIQVFDFKVL